MDEFSKAAHDKKDASDILGYWNKVKYLIWNVVSRLWLLDESWDNLTMRQHLAELQRQISLMQTAFGCRESSSTRAATLLASTYAQSPSDGTSRSGLRGSRSSRLDRRHRRHRRHQNGALGRATRG